MRRDFYGSMVGGALLQLMGRVLVSTVLGEMVMLHSVPVSVELRKGHVWVSIIWAKWTKDHINLCPPHCLVELA